MYGITPPNIIAPAHTHFTTLDTDISDNSSSNASILLLVYFVPGGCLYLHSFDLKYKYSAELSISLPFIG
jgi:hypothetical protein